jgi:hypothetical protein
MESVVGSVSLMPVAWWAKAGAVRVAMSERSESVRDEVMGKGNGIAGNG